MNWSCGPRVAYSKPSHKGNSIFNKFWAKLILSSVPMSPYVIKSCSFLESLLSLSFWGDTFEVPVITGSLSFLKLLWCGDRLGFVNYYLCNCLLWDDMSLTNWVSLEISTLFIF